MVGCCRSPAFSKSRASLVAGKDLPRMASRRRAVNPGGRSCRTPSAREDDFGSVASPGQVFDSRVSGCYADQGSDVQNSILPGMRSAMWQSQRPAKLNSVRLSPIRRTNHETALRSDPCASGTSSCGGRWRSGLAAVPLRRRPDGGLAGGVAGHAASAMDAAVPRAAAGFSRRSAAAVRRLLRTGRARPDAVRSFDGHRQRHGVGHGDGGATLAVLRRRPRAVCAGGVAGQGVFRFRRRAPVLRRCRQRAVAVEVPRAAGRRHGPKTLGQSAADFLVARLGRTGAARRRAVLRLRNLVRLRRLRPRPRPPTRAR